MTSVRTLLSRSRSSDVSPDEVTDAPLSDATLPSIDDVDGPWPAHTVRIDGVDLNIRTTPVAEGFADTAEPALFVHGLGGSALNWTDVAGLLRERLAIEAIDLPGFGRSGPPRRNNYTLQAHANTVIAYLDQSGRGPVHLVGNSMGGAISILVAAQRPDLIRTLTLLAPAVPDVKLRLHPLRSDWRMAFLVVPYLGEAALRKMGSVPIKSRVKATIALCFSDPSRYPQRRFDDDVAEAEIRKDKPWTDQAMLRSTRGLVRSQFLHGRAGWATVRRIQAPALVIWGDRDRLVAPDLSQVLASSLPHARLLFLEDIGHTPMMENPLVVARAVVALLDSAQSSRSAS